MTNFGHGAVDANGVYLFGELDVPGPHWSDTFNLPGASISAVLQAMSAKAILQLTAATPTVSGTSLAVPYDAVDLINTMTSAFTITRSTGALVCAKAGSYRFDGEVSWAANSAGQRSIGLARALAATPTVFTIDRQDEVLVGGGASFLKQNLIRSYLTLAVGDVVHMQAVQTAGAAVNIVGAHLDIKQVA